MPTVNDHTLTFQITTRYRDIDGQWYVETEEGFTGKENRLERIRYGPIPFEQLEVIASTIRTERIAEIQATTSHALAAIRERWDAAAAGEG